MYKLSIILPIYNEELSIPVLFAELVKTVAQYNYEIIAVNDGSKDRSLSVLKEICKKDEHVKVIDFKRNFGQTAAINAGIQYASGDIIVLIDSDLENDPADIPQLLDKINEGYDVVSGWRKERWRGSFLSRKLPSILANKLISFISGVKLHDYGCTLKAYKKEIIKEVLLYGQMHRFIPVYCHWQGGKVTEIPVRYQARKYGKSNYGLFRTYKVILDLILIRFLDKYLQKPIHFFGGIGIICFIMAGIAAVLAFYFKITGQKDLVETPLPVITAMFFIVGMLMILMGVMAEMMMRTYYESQNKFPFSIREKINI